MAHETFEQYKRRRERDRGAPLMLDESNPDHWIYPMPTVEEVVAAGYKPDYHDAVARERAELVRRFHDDPEWRADYIKERRALREAGR